MYIYKFIYSLVAVCIRLDSQLITQPNTGTLKQNR
jgi:hypothetical protein